MNHPSDSIDMNHMPIRSGLEVLIEQLLGHHDAVVVGASALQRGFSAPPMLDRRSVHRSGNAAEAVRHSLGRSLGGQRVAIILEGAGLPAAVESLTRLREAGRPVTAVLWPDPSDQSRLLRDLMDAELTLLSAQSMQETLDLVAAAIQIASGTQAPCLVLGSNREGAWSLGRFARVTATDPDSRGRNDSSSLVDPAHPLGVGTRLEGRLLLKQQAGRVSVRPDLEQLMIESLSTVSRQTGRNLAPVSGADPSSARWMAPAISAPPSTLLDPSGRGMVLTQVFPLPNGLPTPDVATGRIGVLLPAGTGSDDRHPLVRAVDGTHSIREKQSRGLFNRSRQDNGQHTPVTILMDPDMTWSTAHVDALDQAMTESVAPEGNIATAPSAPDIRVLDAGLREATRIPAIEEAFHAARNSGFDPTGLDIPVGGTRTVEPHWLIGARHPHDALRLATGILEHAEAGAVAAPIRNDMGGDALLFLRISGTALPDERTTILLPDAWLLGHRSLRHHLPARTRVLLPETVSGRIPHWMIEQDRTLLLVAADVDWAQLPSLLTASTGKDEDALSIRPVTADDVLAVDSRPPEEVRPNRMAATSATQARVSFQRTLGHLQDMDRLDEAPVDEWILSGTTPPLVPRPNRWNDDARPIPSVITEKCTGCSACWSVCPEAAITTRAFPVAELISTAMAQSEGSFVHLPRLESAWIQGAHALIRKDDLAQYRRSEDLLTESLDRLLLSADVPDPKATAIRQEASRVMEQISRMRLIRTSSWFDEREVSDAGSGWLLSMEIDPVACTRCNLCLQSCPEDALEEVMDLTSGGAFRQLDRLPSFTPERQPSLQSTLPGTQLTGSSTTAAFRSGSTDRANLNRTVIRLAVETHAAATLERQVSVRQAVIERLSALQEAIQESARSQISINDFSAFDRELENRAGKVSDVLQSLLTNHGQPNDAILPRLSSCHRRLQELSDQLGDLDGPALCVVNSLTARSPGLAPFPSNPFGTTSLQLDPESAASALPGLIEAWRHRLLELASILRETRQVMEGTFQEEATAEDLEVDLAWAADHTPRILWLVDRLDAAMLSTVQSQDTVHVCWLDGGPTLDNPIGLLPSQVSRLLDGSDELSMTRSYAGDPVGLLEALESSSARERHIIHVLALDPARDGVPVDALPALADVARNAGLTGSTEAVSASLADWMVLQERFRSHFAPLQRTEWSSDQVSVLEWLDLDAKGRSRVTPCVIRGTGKEEQRWQPDSAILKAAGTWHRHFVSVPAAGADSPTDLPTDSAQPDADPVPEPPAAPSEYGDAHSRLTERLLALSGFQHGGVSLKAWLDEQTSVTNTGTETE